MNSNSRFYEYDESLVKITLAGNLDAFNRLVLRYQNLAYNHAYTLLGDPASAGDATQEGFLKAFQGIHKFRGGSFRAWLLKIVTNTCYDLLRRSQKHPIQPLMPEDEDGDEIESPAWLADPATSVQAAVEQKEEADHLYCMLDELPDTFRSAITLVDLYELDYGEAARALKVPVGTVKSRLARARLQMREKLQRCAGFFGQSDPAMEKQLSQTSALC